MFGLWTIHSARISGDLNFVESAWAQLLSRTRGNGENGWTCWYSFHLFVSQGSSYQNYLFIQIWPTTCLLSLPQKDDEITKLRKQLESRKPRWSFVNSQKDSASEQVHTYRETFYQAINWYRTIKLELSTKAVNTDRHPITPKLLHSQQVSSRPFQPRAHTSFHFIYSFHQLAVFRTTFSFKWTNDMSPVSSTERWRNKKIT